MAHLPMTQGIPQGRFPPEFRDGYSGRTLRLTKLVDSAQLGNGDSVRVHRKVWVRKRDAWQKNLRNYIPGVVKEIAEYDDTMGNQIYLAKVDLGAVIFNVHVSCYIITQH